MEKIAKKDVIRDRFVSSGDNMVLPLVFTISKLEVISMEAVLVGVKQLVVQDESIRVAVLSITAAGTGLTLTVRGPRARHKWQPRVLGGFGSV